MAVALGRPAYALYTRRLRRDVLAAPVPRHLAVILDGNRRWAAGEGLRDAGAGHRRGADKIDELLDWCAPLGIGEITVWALSNENLGRSEEQLAALFEVVCDKLAALEERALQPETAMRVRVIGRFETLPERVSETIRRIEAVDRRTARPDPHDRARLQRPRRADRRLQDARRVARRRRSPGRAHRRADHARVARGPPLHGGRARSRPHHPHERRAAPERVPALAERRQRALLHRRLLAGLPRARPAARAAHLPAARAAPRPLGPASHLGPGPPRAGLAPGGRT